MASTALEHAAKRLRAGMNNNAALAIGFKPSIMVFGDSNTWGYIPGDETSRTTKRFPREKRWSTLLEDCLEHRYVIIPEGLNSRTTVYDDVAGPCDGEYDCNGRKCLTSLLHTHKPLHTVILALGVNDLKSKFHASAVDIVNGIKVLVKDVKRATDIGDTYIEETALPEVEGDLSSEKGPAAGESFDVCMSDRIRFRKPYILVLGPPIVKSTPYSKSGGFDEGVEEKCRRINGLLAAAVKKELGPEVGFLNLATVAQVSETEGVHFPESQQPLIAEAVAKALQELWRGQMS